jgi:hypothetical protein
LQRLCESADCPYVLLQTWQQLRGAPIRRRPKLIVQRRKIRGSDTADENTNAEPGKPDPAFAVSVVG